MKALLAEFGLRIILGIVATVFVGYGIYSIRHAYSEAAKVEGLEKEINAYKQEQLDTAARLAAEAKESKARLDAERKRKENDAKTNKGIGIKLAKDPTNNFNLSVEQLRVIGEIDSAGYNPATR